MSRTVRDVASLVFVIILMVSLLGVYEVGTTDTGQLVFNHMTRNVDSAFASINAEPTKKWPLTPNSAFNIRVAKSFIHNIPNNAWHKGITIKGLNGRKAFVQEDSHGHWFDRTSGVEYMPDIAVQRGMIHVGPDNPNTMWSRRPQTSEYNPNTNTITLSNWKKARRF